MLILTGGRTLKSLCDKNIKFDLLTIADTTDLNYELVRDYIDDVQAPLLFSEGANMNIVKQHKGLKLFYSYNDFIYNIVGRKMSHISTAGSVSHAMTSYAANLGCNPIIFIGQDFAFTGEKYYSKLTAHNYSLKDEERNHDDIFVEDVYGNKVRTNYALNNQRIGMEEIISLYDNVNFINATEGGAKIKGTVEMKLRDVIDKYRGENITSFKEANYDINLRSTAIRELKRAKEIGEKLCDMKITRIDDEIDEFIEKIQNNNLFYYLLYPLIYEFYRTDKDNMTEDINKFYSDIINELKYGLELINNELKMLQLSDVCRK